MQLEILCALKTYLVHETRQNMPIINVEVVMGSENVCWDHRREIASMLIMVRAIEYVYHPFGVGVAARSQETMLTKHGYRSRKQSRKEG